MAERALPARECRRIGRTPQPLSDGRHGGTGMAAPFVLRSDRKHPRMSSEPDELPPAGSSGVSHDRSRAHSSAAKATTRPEASGAWRDEDLVVVLRGTPLPPLCLLSGEPATRTVKCYFHWQTRPASGGLGGLIRHYIQDVRKVWLDIPLSDRLLRRRRIGWALFALTAVLAIATLAGLVISQMQIARMPKDPEMRWWKDIGVPAIAAGGFLLTLLAALSSYKVMPMPTQRLRAVRIDDACVWLSGAAPGYLAQLPDVQRQKSNVRS